MPIPVNINELLHAKAVESSRIEFKADYNPAPILRTICAFANDIDNMGGGYILIGVEEENGIPVFPVKGITPERVDGILIKLHEHCRAITPSYLPVAEPILMGDRYVIVIWAAAGFGRPYRAPKIVLEAKSEQHYYIRKFSSTIAASVIEERELFYVSSDIPFDDRPCLPASVFDLSKELLVTHLRKIQSSLADDAEHKTAEELARDMQLLDFAWERWVPRNVAILMFSEHPEHFFRYARIEFVDKPTPEGDRMFEQTFTGPIQKQLTQALAFIKNYVIRKLIVKHADKAEADHVCNYPYAAVEELLANAVYHRSYAINEPIVVELTPEKLTISSHPGFDRSITDADIARFEIRSRIYRNRRIGDFLKELHLIEGRNTGFPNAVKALRDNGSPFPQIRMDPERSYVDVIIPVHPAFLPKPKKRSSDARYRDGILAVLKNGDMTLTELAAALDYKGISAKLRNTVQDLVTAGFIQKSVTADNRRLLSLAQH